MRPYENLSATELSSKLSEYEALIDAGLEEVERLPHTGAAEFTQPAIDEKLTELRRLDGEYAVYVREQKRRDLLKAQQQTPMYQGISGY